MEWPKLRLIVFGLLIWSFKEIIFRILIIQLDIKLLVEYRYLF